MKPKSQNSVWLVLTFLLGIALGGLSGWKMARGAGPAPGDHPADGGTGVDSVRSKDASSNRSRTAAEKFNPSGDPADDFHRIQRIRDAASRTSAFRQLLDSMSPEGIVELMKTLKRFGEDQEQEDQAGGLIALMASQHLVIEHASLTDPAAVLTAMASSGRAMRNSEFYKDVLRGWAERDPEGARRYFEQSILKDPTGDAKSTAGALVRELVKSDPEGTFRWLRGLKADFTDDVAHDALQTLSHYDGVTAGKLLAQNSDLKKAPEFVAAMTAGWARTEPDKALDWALSLPANIAADGIKTAAGAWAEKDFNTSLNKISALAGEQRASALNGVVSAVGGPHLKELLPLVEALPESADRAAAVGSLLSTWVDKSPAEAATWLTNQPAGASRDQGAAVIALKSMESDPGSALDWATTIGARDQREQGVDGLLDAWLHKDPKAARAWVQQSERLTEEDRTRLLEKTGR